MGKSPQEEVARETVLTFLSETNEHDLDDDQWIEAYGLVVDEISEIIETSEPSSRSK